jgi:hypothetical protein
MGQTILQHFEEINSIPGVTAIDRVLASLLKINPNLPYKESLDIANDLQPGALWSTTEVAETIARILRPEVED